MNEMYSKFREYLDDNTTGNNPKGLGLYFGESENGIRGPYFRQQAFINFVDGSLIEVLKLHVWFGKSLREGNDKNAFGPVVLKMQSVKNTTAFKMEKGESALVKAWKAWNISDKKTYKKYITDKQPTNEQKLKFLRSFPPDAFIGHPDLESLLKK